MTTMDAARVAGRGPEQTVREAAFEVLRRFGLTTIFANPGSTEIAFLTGLPDDFDFTLALHEGSVVGMATGWATATGRPAFVSLHTTAGLANAAGALATARTNRAPLVVVVGQQDRRHLAHDPFLTGRLEGLVGDYPVWTGQPARAQDVPGALARAHHEAVSGAGPALVVVPMDDWLQPAEALRSAAAIDVRRGRPTLGPELDELAVALDEAHAPALVVGSAADDESSWSAVVTLAERLGAPVWQEPFGARAGFPQHHSAFAGHLPPTRSGARSALADNDVVLVLGAPAFRQYPWEPGDLVPAEATVFQVTPYADETHHSIADRAFVADVSLTCRGLVAKVRARAGKAAAVRPPAAALPPPRAGEPLRPGHVFDLLARWLPEDAILVEESPSSRPELHRRVPARAPLGFVSAAAGGLGFGLPAAIGLKLGAPHRPVVAVLGDGSSLYGIQGLWSAAHYHVGALFLVLSNGGYAIMDRLAEQSGQGKQPWPPFSEIRLGTVAAGLGCPADRITSYDELTDALSEVLPTLADRAGPRLLDIEVAADLTYG
ncbi:benzoylformate decarboxylase [Saccharothrix tamanrassetensis]|uniref:Benzoylformate decarboxylase n=1 Tax=Saccharothrix tamanrassetensis TaxID=1051531 RepID=A0A841CFE2_9PSEU|nr:thiamine pyrophosphate-dependent enzyme [Saccharothrix tamanrassetensis]MBB5957262.1 benzoylformate decarboxylase [Saccharothrix tamanrassetensis]